MPRLAGDYSLKIVETSKSILAELVTALKRYDEALALIGGWAPYFILESQRARDAGFQHVGSIDIDLVLNPDLVGAEEYATIAEMLSDRGYVLSETSQFTWSRTVEGQEIGVDFLCPKPPYGRGRQHRHRIIQPDLKARTLKGAEMALEHYFVYPLTTRLPSDGITKVEIRVANLVACLALKGLALEGRYAEKDAYDIYSVCAYCEGGPSSVAAALRPYMSHPILQEGAKAIANRFRDIEAEGPSWVAQFLARDDPEMALRIKQDAYMNVSEVIRLLTAKP